MSNELKHSLAYLGEEYDDGLKHWRYKSKYKNRKGKWVYVYDTKSKVKNAVKGFIDTKITGKAYLQDINNAAERWNTNSDLLKKHNKDLENSTKKDNLTTETYIKVLNGAKKI